MKRIWKALPAALALSTALAAPPGAPAQPASRDTCKATGGGTSYTLDVTIPRGAPAQRGFAFGSPGTSILNLNIQGAAGIPSTSGLPPHTTEQWLLPAPAPAGTFSVDVATSGPVKGSFVMVPISRPPKSYFAAVTCRLVGGTGTNNAFIPQTRATYNPATHTWSEPVTVPGPGSVSFVQVFTRDGSPLITKGAPPRQLIESGELTAGKAGKVELTLRPTPDGRAALQKDGSLDVYLSVTFKPTDSVPLTRIVTLVLRSQG